MRLIDREVLLREMEKLYNKRAVEATMMGNPAYCVTWNDAVYFVTVAPTIEAEPVKHGRNLNADYPSLFECSVCGYVNDDTYRGVPHTFNYCPHCGARMDEVEE